MSPRLTIACPKCGYANSAAEVHCIECGASLAAPRERAAEPGTAVSRPSQGHLYGGTWMALLVFAVLAVCIGVALLGYQPVRISCRRAAVSAPVDCLVQRRILGLFLTSEQTAQDIRSAGVRWMEEPFGGSWVREDERSYRLELHAAYQDVVLPASPGRQAKDGIATQLNAFVGGGKPGTITVTESGWWTWENLGVPILALPGAFLILLIQAWLRPKPRPAGEHVGGGES